MKFTRVAYSYTPVTVMLQPYRVAFRYKEYELSGYVRMLEPTMHDI